MALEQSDFTVENIRFDMEEGDCTAIWFDLAGLRFSEPEAMANMLVDFDDFMDDLQQNNPELHHRAAQAAFSGIGQESILACLDAELIDWNTSLHLFVDRNIDLQAAETTRMGWLHARRSREVDTKWKQLETAAQNTDPSWDEVANRLIEDMNLAAVALYPEINEVSAEENRKFREILEFHMHRLANELVGWIHTSRIEIGSKN